MLMGDAMPDHGHRVLADEARARALAARRSGGVCAACGRTLAAGEPVWVEWFAVDVAYGGQTRWWMPVGAECTSAAFRAITKGTEPDRCAGCGRGVYDRRPTTERRRRALCSRACGRPRAAPPARRRRPAEPLMLPVVLAGDGDPPWVR